MPTNYPYIQVPFANSGDKEDIPTAADPSGAISWTQGYGPDYQRDLETDPLAKPIKRSDMNQLFFAVSAAVKAWQELCFPDWIPAIESGGIQLPYPVGAVVGFTVSGSRTLFVNTVANNTTSPGAGGGWVPWSYRLATGTEVTAGVGNFAPSVTQVRAMVEMFAPAPGDATTSAKGIVQLSSALNDSSDESKASTPAAVARKLTTALSTLGVSENIDTLSSATARGVYWQAVDANATVANGYPAGASAGTLYVTGSVNSAPMQTYVSGAGRMWVRARNSANNAWQPWQATGDTYSTPVVATDYNAISANAQYIFGASAANKPPSFGASWAVHFVSSGNGGTVAYDVASSRTAYRPIAAGSFGAWQIYDPAVDVGKVSIFARSTAPSGYLKANGAAVSRTTYAALFAAIGTTFGAGDGSTTFNLPDLRGEFVRGWDDGRGVDSGRTFGSQQSHLARSLNRAGYQDTSGGSADVNLTWSYENPRSNTWTAIPAGSGSRSITWYADAPETRPRNVALLACIKY